MPEESVNYFPPILSHYVIAIFQNMKKIELFIIIRNTHDNSLMLDFMIEFLAKERDGRMSGRVFRVAL